MDPHRDNPFRTNIDLAGFRVIVAQYVKLLIRARWKSEPPFLSSQELLRWELANIDKDPHSPAQLVGLAADALAIINGQFICRCGSGGIRETSPDVPAERLVASVAFLAAPGGGGPTHNLSLVEAAGLLRKGETIDWSELVNWSLLPAIRDDLDQLPLPGGIDLPNTENQNANVFRKPGRDWENRFRDGKLNPYRHLAGLLYIRCLIQNPGRTHSPLALHAVKHVYENPETAISSNLAAELEVHMDDRRSELCDLASVYRVRDQLTLIDKSLVPARNDNDSSKVAELNNEKEVLLAQLYVAKTYRGLKQESVSKAIKNSRDSVRSAIWRAIESIGEKDSPLARHFGNSIKLGDSEFEYRPEPPEIWITG